MSIGMLCTRQGLNVLSAGMAGDKIIFSRVSIGDGILDFEDETDYRDKVLNLTDIINWKIDIPIVECTNQGDGIMILHCRKDNAEVTEGFFAKERAVYAIDQNTGEEVLYSYINTGDASSFIPGNTGAIAKIIDFSVETVIQNAENVEVKLDASFAYVPLDRYLDHVESSHPHPNTPNHFNNISDGDYFWATNFDNHLHKVSLSNVKAMLVKDLNQNAADNASKVKELELFTSAKNELGLDANLLVIDDLNPAVEVDDFKVKVLSCARGGRLIGVENDTDIFVGAYYWISDGVNQETVKVKGVNFSTDYYRVTLTEPLSNDYDSARVYLYRTTYSDNCDKKKLTWQGGKFSGISANVIRRI